MFLLNFFKQIKIALNSKKDFNAIYENYKNVQKCEIVNIKKSEINYCPANALQPIFNRNQKFYIKRDFGKCIKCGSCNINIITKNNIVTKHRKDLIKKTSIEA